MNILITGGASGLGEAITRTLASQNNFRIYFSYNSSEKNARLLEKTFPNTVGIACDFKNAQSLDGLIEKMSEINPDVLINNAIPAMTEKHFHKMAPSEFLENFQNYLLPTIRVTQKAIEIFRKKRFGKIINILTSALLNNPPIGLSEYTASKAYLASLSKSWAVENGRYNITSNCISPSLMKTKLTSSKDERIFEEFIKNHPLQKLLATDEVAQSILFLVNASQQINGINLVMDAGENL